jgi:hypothetical protein
MGCAVEFVVFGFDFRGVWEPLDVDELVDVEPKRGYSQLCRILDAFDDLGCLFEVKMDHRFDIHRLDDDIRSRRCGSAYRWCPHQRPDIDRHSDAVHPRAHDVEGVE